MTRSVRLLLRDARSHAHQALFHATGLDAEMLADAPEPRHAALYCLVIVGTSFSAVPMQVRALAPAIPWAAVIGLRNLVVHAHWQIDLTIIAGVIEDKLEPLILELNSMLALIESGDQ